MTSQSFCANNARFQLNFVVFLIALAALSGMLFLSQPVEAVILSANDIAATPGGTSWSQVASPVRKFASPFPNSTHIESAGNGIDDLRAGSQDFVESMPDTASWVSGEDFELAPGTTIETTFHGRNPNGGPGTIFWGWQDPWNHYRMTWGAPAKNGVTDLSRPFAPNQGDLSGSAGANLGPGQADVATAGNADGRVYGLRVLKVSGNRNAYTNTYYYTEVSPTVFRGFIQQQYEDYDFALTVGAGGQQTINISSVHNDTASPFNMSVQFKDSTFSTGRVGFGVDETDRFGIDEFDIDVIPEPSTLFLGCFGLISLVALNMRRSKK